MAASRVGRMRSLAQQHHRADRCFSRSQYPLSVSRRHQALHRRPFSTSSRRLEQQRHRKETFSSRLRASLGKTKIEWRSIPVGLGIGFLGAAQLWRVQRRERHNQAQDEKDAEDEGHEEQDVGRPKKRKRIRPSGPWSVQVMSTLPLKGISRLWGKFNELQIPYYLRVPGFRLYSYIFGVNLSEVSEADLHVYPNLASFFYRTLKPGVRPIDPNSNALVSPADGKVIQFGTIEQGQVEQVKGVTYSLDALLGAQRPLTASSNIASSSQSPQPSAERNRSGDQEHIDADEEFAQVNGISYTLPNLFSGQGSKPASSTSDLPSDQSTMPRPSSESEVGSELALSDAEQEGPWWAPLRNSPTRPTTLYYMVVYLAPGDYHRFHSPVSWVVSQRRHFSGELYSVSPYLQRTLPGLFTLNERVVLLGRWRWGFFSYTPVGATNVGSIVVNFDRELRTNSLTTDTAADRIAEKAQKRGEPYSGFAEANYYSASPKLGGHALSRGEEMGGFQLGSTIVMVFEGPKGLRKSFDEGYAGGERKGGWKWNVEKGQKVKVGQALGQVIDEED
ncbi:MAG: phosphatidylserine decarboxylase 1 [Chrysothrix sp. TS-e1954]|nr:MAG: phosphatidylserine decarboxylase 1 [Chrysothrix sp. TS-e1954]